MRVLLALALVATALAAAAAASAAPAKEAPARAWAQGACAQVDAWLGSLQRESTALVARIASGDLAQARGQVVRFLDGTIARTRALTARIDALGVPDATNGARVADALDAALARLSQAFARARASAAAVDVTDAKAFAARLTALGKTLEREGTAIGRTFTSLGKRIPSPELERAFAAAPACRKLR